MDDRAALVLWTVCGLLAFRSAIAGKYELTVGAGVLVCEAYRRNFEPRQDAEPMACERLFDPAIKGFAAVPWKKLDLEQKFELYREAEVDLATNVNSEQGAVLSAANARRMAENLRGKAENLRGKAEHLKVDLYVARLPLFGESRGINVLSVRELACGSIPKATVKISRLFALNESLTHLDSRNQTRFEGWGNNATIELFKGTPYLETYRADDNWGTLFTGSALTVWKSTKDGFEAVCKVSFTP